MRYLTVRDLACLIAVAATVPGLVAPRDAAAEEFDSHVKSEVMVPMRDGVRLATDVYRPAVAGEAAEGRFPVLLFRSPYGKGGVRRNGEFFTRHGYVVVAQDCRGTYRSEGEFYPFVNEGKDGYDAIRWAAAQPWSNAKVGTMGASYLGWVQLYAAMYRPPHLQAMFVEVAGADFLREVGHPGGVPNLGWPAWLVKSAVRSPRAARDPELAEPLRKIMDDPLDWWRAHPGKRAEVFRDFPDQRRMYEDFYNHTERDGYWQQPGFYPAGHYDEMKDVPMLFLSGWYDFFVEGTLDNFAALARLQETPKRVVIGPWPHAAGRAECGDVYFGPEAAVSQRELALDWFDHWMKGSELRTVGSQPARLFRMGGGDGTRTATGLLNHGGRWIEAPSWPLPDAKAVDFYLNAGASLQSNPPARAKPSTYVFDPNDPVPTVGGRSGVGPWSPGGPRDQVCSAQVACCADAGRLTDRGDVLSFQTEPLEAAVEVTGKVRARLWISSDAVDTDFTAKLMDVYPDGYAMILCDGQIRTRYRNGRDRAELMTPGEVYAVTIDVGSTSNLFAAGHCIRVDISSSNYPKCEPNPNTGEPAGRWTRRVKATNSVYHDAEHPSHIELPLVVRD